MDAQGLQDQLRGVFEGFELDDADEFRSVRTFEELGLLTREQGLVVTTEDGDEFQITIVQTGFAGIDDEGDE